MPDKDDERHDDEPEDEAADEGPLGSVTLTGLRAARRKIHERIGQTEPHVAYLDRARLPGEENLWGTMTLHHPDRDIRVEMVNRCTADVIGAWTELLRGDDDPPQHAFAMEALLEGAGVIMVSSRALANVLAVSWSPGKQ